MGDDEGSTNEKPAHPAHVDAFEIDLTETTVGQYATCVKAGGCSPAETTVTLGERASAEDRTLSSGFCNGARTDRFDHPANCVDWKQASAFCAWAGKRLCTEEEWEFAARGTDGRRYPWGSEAPDATRLNACGAECVAMGHRLGRNWHAMYPGSDGWETTAPVGSFPRGKSPFGVFDMAGNVWEWTASLHRRDYAQRRNEKLRTIRGGGWVGDSPSTANAVVRVGNYMLQRFHETGFRCCATPVPPDSFAVVHIPGGVFTMGSPDGVGTPAERPQHQVTVGAFDMDVTEVTVAAYAACVRAGGCSATTGDPFSCNYGHVDRSHHPINCVTWNQAQTYCRAQGKRLPTEEEWEYAAKGGAEGRTYPWGNADPTNDQLCWSRKSERTGTCPVGEYSGGAFGLKDLAGNVAEWTSSRLSVGYAYNPSEDVRMTRGGAYDDNQPSAVRGAAREWRAPENYHEHVGFRCAR